MDGRSAIFQPRDELSYLTSHRFTNSPLKNEQSRTRLHRAESINYIVLGKEYNGILWVEVTSVFLDLYKQRKIRRKKKR